MSSSTVPRTTVSVGTKLRRALELMELPTRHELDTLTELYRPITRAEVDALRALVAATDAVAALPAVQKMRAPGRVEKHCARCHNTYTERDNTLGACRIAHLFEDEPGSTINLEEDFDWDRETIVGYYTTCCEDNVILKEEGEGTQQWVNFDKIGPCFRGRHTTNSTRITYKRFSNIVRCKLDANGRCTEEGRGWDEYDDPVFDHA